MINQCREYKGVVLYSNGAIHEGGFFRGSPSGRGRTILPTGDWYEGEFLSGKFHGKGKYSYANGSSYDGEWKNHQKHGKGIEKEVDGSTYSGDFVNGVREGEGKLSMYDGSIYIGGFLEGLQDGIGILVGPSPIKYTGEWKRGKKHGRGKYIDKERNAYEGEFVEDAMHGRGGMTMYYRTISTNVGATERSSRAPGLTEDWWSLRPRRSLWCRQSRRQYRAWPRPNRSLLLPPNLTGRPLSMSSVPRPPPAFIEQKRRGEIIMFVLTSFYLTGSRSVLPLLPAAPMWDTFSACE